MRAKKVPAKNTVDPKIIELLRQIERNTRHALTPIQREAAEKESKA